MASANPGGGTVVSGNVTISNPDAVTTQVDQTSNTAIVNWDNFFVDTAESVIFNQPTAQSAILNRIVAGQGTAIFGQIKSNGRVFLIDPNGFYIDPTASFDVGAVVISNLDIADSDFLSGNYKFARGTGAPDAQIFNGGTIHAMQDQNHDGIPDGGGFIVLASNNTMYQYGELKSDLGGIGLGLGDEMLLQIGDDGLINFRVTRETLAATAQMDAGGLMFADGGRIFVDAQTTMRIVRNEVSGQDEVRGNLSMQDAYVSAQRFEEQDGQIFITSKGGKAYFGNEDIDASEMTVRADSLVIQNSRFTGDRGDFAINDQPHPAEPAAGTDAAMLQLISEAGTVFNFHDSLNLHAEFDLSLTDTRIGPELGGTPTGDYTLSADRKVLFYNDNLVNGRNLIFRAGAPGVSAGFVQFYGERNNIIGSGLVDMFATLSIGALADSNPDIDPEASVANITAGALRMETGFDIQIDDSVLTIGNGDSGVAGDPLMVAAARSAGLGPVSDRPNASFVADVSVQLGTVHMTGDHIYVRTNLLGLYEPVSGPSRLFFQYQPFTSDYDVGIENEYGSNTLGLAFRNNQFGNLDNLQDDSVFAVGGSGYHGNILVGAAGGPLHTEGGPQNFAFYTDAPGVIFGAKDIETTGQVAVLKGIETDTPPAAQNIDFLDIIFGSIDTLFLNTLVSEQYDYVDSDNSTSFRAQADERQSQVEGQTARTNRRDDDDDVEIRSSRRAGQECH